MEYTERLARGKALFEEGYSCSQAVVIAFSDLTGIDEKTAALLSSSFGGGMARLRDTCGAVSGMAMVAGLLFGYSDPTDHAKKSAHYERVRRLIGEFTAENGSYVCRELLAGVPHTAGGVPEQRDPAYYKKRPCGEYVACAVGILERELIEEGKIEIEQD